MPDWDKAEAIAWIKAHKGEEIVIRVKGTTVRLQGRAGPVEDVDACATEFQECELHLGHDHLHLALSFHGHALSIHFAALKPEGGESVISMPLSIPYTLLDLRTAEALAKEPAGAGQPEEEPEFSPYELLH